jgi:hypothetical protein
MIVGIAAGFTGALLPVNFYAERGTFEEPLSALLMMSLLVFQRFCSTTKGGLPIAALTGVAYGFTLLVSPTLLSVLATFSVLTVFQSRTVKGASHLAVTLIVMFLVLTPWALRNRSVLGSAVWLRSNFGLELSMSNMDGAKPTLEENIARGGVHSIRHPYANRAELAAYRRMGELAYYDLRLREGVAWICDNKVNFFVLSLRRAFSFWFPKSRYDAVTYLSGAITVLAIAGAVLWAQHNLLASLPMILVFGAFPAVYYIIEASRRYRYPIEGMMMLMASYTVFRIMIAIRRVTLSGPGERLRDYSSAPV